MTDKMTNRKALAYVLENCDLPTEVAEKVEKMVAQLDKKSSAERKPTARQAENAVVRAEIVDYINENYAEGGDHDPVLTEARKDCPKPLKGR